MAREMKDSGISWIEMIPENWHLIRIKFCSSLKGRIGWQGLTTAEYIDEGPYLVTGIDFKEGSIDWSHCNHVDAKRWEEDPFIQITNGDLLITKDGTVGKVAIVEGLEDKATLNSGVMLIRPTRNIYNTRYLYWILCSEVFKKWFSEINAGISTIIHLYQGDFFNFSFPLPSIDTQSIIASFLDTKCTEIDKAIEATKASIEEYKKLKQAIITEAVTKGLDPDVEMKDSGVEWIGIVNSKWNIIDLKYCLKEPLKYGASESGVEYCDSLPRYIRITDISIDGRLKDDNKLSLTETQAEGYILKHNSILFARSGATVGKAFLYKTDYGRSAFAGYLISALPNDDLLLPGWLMYYTQSTIYKEWCSYIFSQATIQNIGADKYANIPLTLPPIYEQDNIIEYLDRKCFEIDSLIKSKEKLIEELTAYRKSLIYECVTGKKEVPVESA